MTDIMAMLESWTVIDWLVFVVIPLLLGWVLGRVSL